MESGMNKRFVRRIIAALLAFAIFIEPIAIQIIRAESLLEPTVINDDIGLMEPSEILPPHDYLEAMLDFRGHNQEEVELRVWGEWQNLINSAYLVIDEGATDVFGFYDALKTLKTVKSTTCDVGSIIGDVSKYAHMVTAFFDKISRTNRAHTALSCWTRLNQWTEKAVELCKNSKTLNFLSFCCPPSSWHNKSNVAKGMDQYWRWLQQKGGKNVTTELTNAQAVARSIGIGFAILGTALALWQYLGNEDRSVDRWSYNRVKDLAAIGFAAAGIVAMFCIPVVGQVAAIVATIWGVVTAVGDLVGKYNKRWKNAYKNSYWYLYENDPEFKSFYENRELLKNEEKSASFLVVDENYGDFKVTSATNDDSVEARNGRIYIALEKQGVLTSYYNRNSFRLPDFDITRLMELWEMKANYMAWKPTEAEKNKKKGFWQSLGVVFNPDTYISWGANKIASRKYNKLVKEENIEKVYFNPDYVLMKKYQFYITANRLSDSFYNALGLRIEQSPFNYIPLVGMELANWNLPLLQEAFAADAFIVGQKEMVAVHNQIELAVQGLDSAIDGADDLVKMIDKKHLPHSAKVRKFLNDFAQAYSSSPNKEDAKLFSRARSLIGFDWDGSKKKTPANILERCREDIEKALLYDPLSLSQKGAEMVLLTITVKQQMDMAVLMNAYVEDKCSALKVFDKDFKHADIVKYLEEGSFLSVKGGGFLDWLSELYSPYDESKKTLKLIEKNVIKYSRLADKGASDKRSSFLGFKKSVTTPPELVEKINIELAHWRDTIEAWSAISSEANVRVVLDEDREFAERVLASFDISNFKLESLDPDDASIVDINLPYCQTDSVKVEGAAAVLIK